MPFNYTSDDNILEKALCKFVRISCKPIAKWTRVEQSKAWLQSPPHGAADVFEKAKEHKKNLNEKI